MKANVEIMFKNERFTAFKITKTQVNSYVIVEGEVKNLEAFTSHIDVLEFFLEKAGVKIAQETVLAKERDIRARRQRRHNDRRTIVHGENI